MNPITFLRQVRYQGVKDVAVVQTGPAELLLRVAERVRGVFPGCAVHVIARADAAIDRADLPHGFLEVMRPEERDALVARLRRKSFDAVVVLLAGEPMGELGWLALKLRGRSLIAFNDNLDHFALSVHRLTTIAHHFGATGQGGLLAVVEVLARLAARFAISVVCAVYLVGVAAWLHARGLVRRLRAA